MSNHCKYVESYGCKGHLIVWYLSESYLCVYHLPVNMPRHFKIWILSVRLEPNTQTTMRYQDLKKYSLIKCTNVNVKNDKKEQLYNILFLMYLKCTEIYVFIIFFIGIVGLKGVIEVKTFCKIFTQYHY